MLRKEIAAVEAKYLRKDVPDFRGGDTVRVHTKIKEGDKERIQLYEGVVIASSGGGPRAMFTVRKVSYGVGVERIFPVHSPRIDKVEVVGRGDVRRSRLYYLREPPGEGRPRPAGRRPGRFRRLEARRGLIPAVAGRGPFRASGTRSTVLRRRAPARDRSPGCSRIRARAGADRVPSRLQRGRRRRRGAAPPAGRALPPRPSPDPALRADGGAGGAGIRAGLTLSGDDGVIWRVVRDLAGPCQLQRYDPEKRTFQSVVQDPARIAEVLRAAGVPSPERFAAVLSVAAVRVPFPAGPDRPRRARSGGRSRGASPPRPPRPGGSSRPPGPSSSRRGPPSRSSRGWTPRSRTSSSWRRCSSPGSR